MKRVTILILLAMSTLFAMAQTSRIDLRSESKAECVKSDMTSLKASFSFSSIEAEDYQSERGTFSWISLPNTVIGGNEGDPQVPVVNELIAIPVGASPRVEITSYSVTDYRLEDYGIHTLVPRQPSLRKDLNAEDVPFVYNAEAYQTRGLASAPRAYVNVDGIMRGVCVGKMSIDPVSYDPVNNTLRVFNDIEVEVFFDGADAQATEDQLISTYSPYFDIIYKQLFNGRAVLDIYTDHPDLYTTPVKMIVITNSTYASNAKFQEWVIWKKQKGIYTTIYDTSTTGTSASALKTFIRNCYNTDAPTFVVLVGDKDVVAASTTSNTTSKVTDLYYSSTTDADLYPEMFLSRMPVSSTNDLTNLLTKILMYEQYTMPDPSYLNETLLIAGWDSNWTNRVGKPTIQYANNYYFNSSNGITPHVFITTGSNQTTCYNYISQVGFANYTAHGDNTEWSDPRFTVSNVNQMTNTNKYLWAMGNCCLAANWGYNGTCFAEAMLRAANKGAFGYIGSCPETYWYEDYYFGVGATTTLNNMPQMANTSTGCYDAMFDDTGFNTLNSVPFIGNLAVAYAHAGNYQYSVSDKYYWEAYHTLGDGSVMPYHKVPDPNNVSHASTFPAGATSFPVSAIAGSYVAITQNNEIIGVGLVPSSGTVDVPVTPVTGGSVMIVVTRQQRQPYVTTIQVGGGASEYTITVSANPTNGGTVTGGGTFSTGSTRTVTATANSGYTFTNWTENGNVVSTNASYTFTLNYNRNLVANFALPTYTVTATPNPLEGGYVTISHRDRAELTYNFDDSDQGWTTIDADGDGYEWMLGSAIGGVYLQSGGSLAGNGHNASADLMCSGSYSNVVGVLTPDNYLVSPQVQLGGSITFWACGQDANYVSEHFGVAVSTTNNTSASAFTTIQEWTMTAKSSGAPTEYTRSGNRAQGSWHEYTVDLSAYSGTGYVAIRHFNCSDMFILNVDDITIVEGTGGGAPVSDTFEAGQTCILTAHPNQGYNFVNWTENGTVVSSNATYSFTVTSNRNLVANFSQGGTTNYNVSVSANPTNGGTVTGGGSFSAGSNCTVTASANNGYTFTNWTENGSVVSTNASYTFTVNSNRTLVAHFTQNAPTNYTISVSANPTNGGTVTGGGTFAQGQSCTVSATPNTGYTFVNWTENGTVVSSNQNYSFNVTGNRNLVAKFERKVVKITVSVDPAEGGTVTGAGSYNYGDQVTLTITPAQNFVFVNWTENGAVLSASLTLTFQATTDRELVAHLLNNEGVDELQHNIAVYPNPTQGEITVEGEGMSQIRIMNAYGQVVYNSQVDSELVRIDLSQMASGVYVMHISTANGQAIKQIVVK